MRAGALNRRVTFERLTAGGTDDYGNALPSTWTALGTVWGGLQIGDGREAVREGRLDAVLGAVLRVRCSAFADAITEADRAVIDGEAWQILTKANRDQHNRFWEMKLMRGVAT